MPVGRDASLGSITVDDVPIPRVEIELSDPPTELQLVHAAAKVGKVLALIRLHSRPLGIVVLDGTKGTSWQAHASAVWLAMSDTIIAHLKEDGLAAVADIDALRVPTSILPECERRRAAVLANAPQITVIVATRERPTELQTCLVSLLEIDYPAYDIVVVDNDPVSDDTVRLVKGNFGERVRYLREDRRGLAWAHNCGLRQVEADIVAFTDDDVVVDPHWLTSIAEGFAAEADVACVTGLILPEQLNTPAQLLLHQYIGYGYYGFTQRVFDMGRNRPADQAFPLSVGKAGSGANMAFATRVLRQQGGFDPALGIGTKTYAGDETAAFVRTVLRHQLVYQPAAIVWHRNHRDIAMSKEAFHLGISTGALLTSVMLHERTMWAPMLRCAPPAIVGLLKRSGSRDRSPAVGLPNRLKRLQKLNMLRGPFRYGQSRWRVRQLSRPSDKV